MSTHHSHPAIRRRLRSIPIGVLGCAAAFVALTVWAALGLYMPGEDTLLMVIVTHRLPAGVPFAQFISALGSINVVLPLWAVVVTALAARRQAAAF
ncbi:MAG TPA: hypothetical protein VF932_10050, partial [Anaerolineae bacterium]